MRFLAGASTTAGLAPMRSRVYSDQVQAKDGTWIEGHAHAVNVTLGEEAARSNARVKAAMHDRRLAKQEAARTEATIDALPNVDDIF